MTTLADLERATARRVGPYYRAFADRQLPSTAQFDSVLVPGLRSSVEQDLVTNLWLLRRGWDVNGNPVAVDPIDRQRLVANFDAERGQVTVDRPWSVIPAAAEVLEFHHLDPEQELREAVRAGLRRCYMEDRYSLGNGYVYEVDLTSALPWLTEPRDIQRVEVAPYPAGNFPAGWYGGPQDIPFEVFTQVGHVCLRINSGWGGPYYGGLNVVVRRQAFSLVNGLDAELGPQHDDDVLNVDFDYAVAASHIEAWHNFPAKLQAAAAGNLQASQKDAAIEFTRQSVRHAPTKRDRYGMKSMYGIGAMRLTVVNA